MNYYRRYVGDYGRDTSLLSLMEHGAYCVLLDHYYASEEPLPSDREDIYRVARAVKPEERRAVDKILSRYFVEEPAGFRNTRADAELRRAQPALAAARENGKKGGRPSNPIGYCTDSQRDTYTDNPVGCVDEPIGKTIRAGDPTTNHQPPTTNHQKPEKKETRKRVPLPESFWISDRVKAWAVHKGYQRLPEYLEFFVGRMKASGKTYVDWDEAFMNCIREDWAGLRGKGTIPSVPHPMKCDACGATNISSFTQTSRGRLCQPCYEQR